MISTCESFLVGAVHQQLDLWARQITEEEVEALYLCNRFAGAAPAIFFQGDFYPLKTRLLHIHAIPAGYDLQTWASPVIDRRGVHHNDEVFAVHKHILRRWLLGGYIFHEPTEDWYYENALGRCSHSERFLDFENKCVGELRGRKRAPLSSVDLGELAEAWALLKSREALDKGSKNVIFSANVVSRNIPRL